MPKVPYRSYSVASRKLNLVKEIDDSDNFEAIDGHTNCRVIFDSAEFYPDLKLPSPVLLNYTIILVRGGKGII